MSTVDPDDAWANHPVDGGPLTMGTGPDMSTFFDAIDAAEAAEAERHPCAGWTPTRSPTR